MSKALDLHDVNALDKFKISLGQFSKSTCSNMSVVEIEIKKTVEWINERIIYWRKQVNIARADVTSAQNNLMQCRSRRNQSENGNYREPDCSLEQREFEIALRMLREYENHLSEVQSCKIRVEQSIDDYHRSSRSLQSLLGTHVEKCCGYLSDLNKKYISIHQDGNYFAGSINSFQGNYSRITASQFGSALMTALSIAGLSNLSSILKDNTSKKAEQLAQTILKGKGLPIGNELIALKNVVAGKYNEAGNGIDFVGITETGEPIPLEIKKRENPQKDKMGNDNLKMENLEPETQNLVNHIIEERSKNPVYQEREKERLRRNDPDLELSSNQMGELWTRDRWIKLIKNLESKESLQQAGIRQEFLNLNTLSLSPYIPEWDTILSNRTTIIVTRNKNDVSAALLREAVLKRGSNISIIDLEI